MAEGVFEQLVHEAGLSDQIEVDSAGVMDWNTDRPAHRGTRDVLRRRGITYEGCARQVSLDDLIDADYVVAMDTENVHHLCRMAPHGMLADKLFLLLDFAPPGFPQGVPDPIYDGRFEDVYDLVEAGCLGLLDHIRSKYELRRRNVSGVISSA
jgi:protein-tyrosine phosphatase